MQAGRDEAMNQMPAPPLPLPSPNILPATAHFLFGMAITAASSTIGCPIARFSISIVLIHSPPDFTTSFDRSVMDMCPSLSMLATSASKGERWGGVRG